MYVCIPRSSSPLLSTSSRREQIPAGASEPFGNVRLNFGLGG